MKEIELNLMEFTDLISQNEEKLSSLRRSLIEVDEMIC